MVKRDLMTDDSVFVMSADWGEKEIYHKWWLRCIEITKTIFFLWKYNNCNVYDNHTLNLNIFNTRHKTRNRQER